jgi:alpha-L-fucosidase
MLRWLTVLGLLVALITAPAAAPPAQESRAERDARMQWWREARFGLFIHWGLYSIPAGEWAGRTDHAEWIRTSAQIPLAEYDKLVAQFNPVKFDADAWVRAARDAGMKYMVITSKHHDGFCLFDSEFTDFHVMASPARRDFLKELAEACRRHGLKLCFYHSIMDWHHPDYLPRRDWEKDRSAAGAVFDRYVEHMKRQLRELLTNYGEIGVLWFDGEWESTWTNARGRDLYRYVRGLQPKIIINNRVGAGRSGMEGFTKEGEFAGDFGTPEQQVPATGLPGVDWESCLTMNNNWGFNKHDQNWKSSTELIRTLADIASKGGNLLLNVGPTAEGEFPQPSLDRLRDIGAWMRVNSEAIYATSAGPFKSLPWGRATQKAIPGGTRLYLHVFDWPADGKLRVPGIYNQPIRAWFLADPQKTALEVARDADALVIRLPRAAPDAVNTVVALDIAGAPDVSHPPEISAEFDIFVGALEVRISSERKNVELRYTTDGTAPGSSSPRITGPLRLQETATVSARAFRDGRPVSETATQTFTKVAPRPAEKVAGVVPGLRYAYFEGEWDRLPDFSALTPQRTGTLANFSFAPRAREERFAFEYTGYVRVPADGVYAFYTDSDDGSRLYIGDTLVVDNDGLHGMREARGVVALAEGLHPLRVTFFEKTGGDGLTVSFQGPHVPKRPIPDSALFRPRPILQEGLP